PGASICASPSSAPIRPAFTRAPRATAPRRWTSTGAAASGTSTASSAGDRTMTRSFLIVLVSGGLALTALGAASADSAKAPFAVRSTLDGKTVLPHRVRWLAFPHLPSSQVREVDFLIDGKVRWIEHNAPYSYSDDGGFLVTSWLSPTRHSFAVRVISYSGRRGIDTVVARVVAAPTPPAELAGRWQRDVPTEVPGDQACGASDPVPAGRWTLVFERRWIETIYPGRFDPVKSQQTLTGYILDNDYVPGPTKFEVAGSVTVNL